MSKMESTVVDHLENNEQFSLTNTKQLEQEITCSHCTRLLNIKPIYTLEEDDGSRTMCGRCLHVVKEFEGTKTRQVAYESLIKFMTFPCAFEKEGCTSILPGEKVLDHELGCFSATVICPANDNGIYKGPECRWSGNAAHFQHHIEEDHKDCILDPPYFDKLPEESKMYFTHVNKKLAVIALIKIDAKNYRSCVFLIGSDMESQFYRYQLELSEGNDADSILLRKGRLQPFGYFESILANKENLLDINLDIIQPTVTQSKARKPVSAKFSIAMKHKKVINQISESLGIKCRIPKSKGLNQIVNNTLDENLLAELVCPVCIEFMVPPIYICESGHSICNRCVELVRICPNCRSSLTKKTRNFTLESVTTRVQYPCKNQEIGCGFLTTSDKIRMHEQNCDLEDSPCVFNCGLKFRKPALFNHVNEEHPDRVLAFNEIHTLDIKSNTKEFIYLLIASGQMFKLTIKVTGGHTSTSINMQQLNENDENLIYRYKFEFVDTSDSRLATCFMGTIQPAGAKPSKLTEVVIPHSIIANSIDDNFLSYRISLSIINLKA
ncbi:uncharacterized protein LOC126881165 [Diabrotica virgifera virgifera]|uniref:RING-type E3 ubiquitin transferase n=1 Tax=Diabrotica virgifera virgifera TaxID=50390 RepID=A0A6P7GD41_DIAVI|nr:uncharacterized protein LOC126881165 [Diabrotica virgifera virgifera]